MPRPKTKLGQRIAALEKAQSSHSSENVVRGGQCLVLPGRSGADAERTPMMAPIYDTRHNPAYEKEMISSSWAKLSEVGSVDENDENDNLAQVPIVVPIPPNTSLCQQQSVHPSQKCEATLDSSTSVNEKIDLFLSHVTQLTPPEGASQREADEPHNIVDMAKTNLSSCSSRERLVVLKSSTHQKTVGGAERLSHSKSSESNDRNALPKKMKHLDSNIDPTKRGLTVPEMEIQQAASGVNQNVFLQHRPRGRLGIDQRIDVFGPLIEPHRADSDDLESIHRLRLHSDELEDDTVASKENTTHWLQSQLPTSRPTSNWGNQEQEAESIILREQPAGLKHQHTPIKNTDHAIEMPHMALHVIRPSRTSSHKRQHHKQTADCKDQHEQQVGKEQSRLRELNRTIGTFRETGHPKILTKGDTSSLSISQLRQKFQQVTIDEHKIEKIERENDQMQKLNLTFTSEDFCWRKQQLQKDSRREVAQNKKQRSKVVSTSKTVQEMKEAQNDAPTLDTPAASSFRRVHDGSLCVKTSKRVESSQAHCAIRADNIQPFTKEGQSEVKEIDRRPALLLPITKEGRSSSILTSGALQPNPRDRRRDEAKSLSPPRRKSPLKVRLIDGLRHKYEKGRKIPHQLSAFSAFDDDDVIEHPFTGATPVATSQLKLSESVSILEQALVYTQYESLTAVNKQNVGTQTKSIKNCADQKEMTMDNQFLTISNIKDSDLNARKKGFQFRQHFQFKKVSSNLQDSRSEKQQTLIHGSHVSRQALHENETECPFAQPQPKSTHRGQKPRKSPSEKELIVVHDLSAVSKLPSRGKPVANVEANAAWLNSSTLKDPVTTYGREGSHPISTLMDDDKKDALKSSVFFDFDSNECAVRNPFQAFREIAKSPKDEALIPTNTMKNLRTAPHLEELDDTTNDIQKHHLSLTSSHDDERHNTRSDNLTGQGRNLLNNDIRTHHLSLSSSYANSFSHVDGRHNTRSDKCTGQGQNLINRNDTRQKEKKPSRHQHNLKSKGMRKYGEERVLVHRQNIRFVSPWTWFGWKKNDSGDSSVPNAKITHGSMNDSTAIVSTEDAQIQLTAQLREGVLRQGVGPKANSDLNDEADKMRETHSSSSRLWNDKIEETETEEIDRLLIALGSMARGEMSSKVLTSNSPKHLATREDRHELMMGKLDPPILQSKPQHERKVKVNTRQHLLEIQDDGDVHSMKHADITANETNFTTLLPWMTASQRSQTNEALDYKWKPKTAKAESLISPHAPGLLFDRVDDEVEPKQSVSAHLRGWSSKEPIDCEASATFFRVPTPVPSTASQSGMTESLDKRAYASDPIRNYWRAYSNIRSRGSFDSVSLKNGKGGGRSPRQEHENKQTCFSKINSHGSSDNVRYKKNEGGENGLRQQHSSEQCRPKRLRENGLDKAIGLRYPQEEIEFQAPQHNTPDIHLLVAHSADHRNTLTRDDRKGWKSESSQQVPSPPSDDLKQATSRRLPPTESHHTPKHHSAVDHSVGESYSATKIDGVCRKIGPLNKKLNRDTNRQVLLLPNDDCQNIQRLSSSSQYALNQNETVTHSPHKRNSTTRADVESRMIWSQRNDSKSEIFRKVSLPPSTLKDCFCGDASQQPPLPQPHLASNQNSTVFRMLGGPHLVSLFEGESRKIWPQSEDFESNNSRQDMTPNTDFMRDDSRWLPPPPPPAPTCCASNQHSAVVYWVEESNSVIPHHVATQQSAVVQLVDERQSLTQDDAECTKIRMPIEDFKNGISRQVPLPKDDLMSNITSRTSRQVTLPPPNDNFKSNRRLPPPPPLPPSPPTNSSLYVTQPPTTIVIGEIASVVNEHKASSASKGTKNQIVTINQSTTQEDVEMTIDTRGGVTKSLGESCVDADGVNFSRIPVGRGIDPPVVSSDGAAPTCGFAHTHEPLDRREWESTTKLADQGEGEYSTGTVPRGLDDIGIRVAEKSNEVLPRQHYDASFERTWELDHTDDVNVSCGNQNHSSYRQMLTSETFDCDSAISADRDPLRFELSNSWDSATAVKEPDLPILPRRLVELEENYRGAMMKRSSFDSISTENDEDHCGYIYPHTTSEGQDYGGYIFPDNTTSGRQDYGVYAYPDATSSRQNHADYAYLYATSGRQDYGGYVFPETTSDLRDDNYSGYVFPDATSNRRDYYGGYAFPEATTDHHDHDAYVFSDPDTQSYPQDYNAYVFSDPNTTSGSQDYDGHVFSDTTAGFHDHDGHVFPESDTMTGRQDCDKQVLSKTSVGRQSNEGKIFPDPDTMGSGRQDYDKHVSSDTTVGRRGNVRMVASPSVYSRELPSPLRDSLIHAMSPMLSGDTDGDDSDASSDEGQTRDGDWTAHQACPLLCAGLDFVTIQEQLGCFCWL